MIYMNEIDRKFLINLWNNKQTICPNCESDYLVPLHKKKKDNIDWQCPKCKEIYRTINIFNKILNEEAKKW